MYLQNSKESARLHGAALDCLVTLFDNYGSSLDLEDFGAAKLYVDVLQRSEKTTYQPSVRGKMFALLGTLGALGDNSYMRQPNWFQQLFSHITATITHQVGKILFTFQDLPIISVLQLKPGFLKLLRWNQRTRIWKFPFCMVVSKDSRSFWVYMGQT